MIKKTLLVSYEMVWITCSLLFMALYSHPVIVEFDLLRLSHWKYQESIRANPHMLQKKSHLSTVVHR